jgi:hypothetical protein
MSFELCVCCEWNVQSLSGVTRPLIFPTFGDGQKIEELLPPLIRPEIADWLLLP